MRSKIWNSLSPTSMNHRPCRLQMRRRAAMPRKLSYRSQRMWRERRKPKAAHRTNRSNEYEDKINYNLEDIDGVAKYRYTLEATKTGGVLAPLLSFRTLI